MAVMLIEKPKLYVGFNRFTRFNTIHVRIQHQEDEANTEVFPEETLSQLATISPELAKEIENLQPSTTIGTILSSLIGKLLKLGGEPSNHIRVRTAERHEDVEIGYWSKSLASSATRVAINIVCKLQGTIPIHYQGKLSDLDTEPLLKTFLKLSRGSRLDLSTFALVKQAQSDGIPWRRILPGTCMVQLGQGKHVKLIHETITSQTGYLAAHISARKSLALQMLSEVGLPIPEGLETDNGKGLHTAINGFGFPLVIKPAAESKGGENVFCNLTSEALAREAFERVFQSSPLVRIEKHIPGEDHRLLIVNGKLVAACRRRPASIMGDGEHSVRELIDIENEHPDRGNGFEKVMVKLTLDNQVQDKLLSVGITPDSIPAKNAIVYLRDTANISSGGTAVDVTDSIHPDNAKMAVLAAKTLGLDVAGVDFITRDIKRSWQDIGGAICEVNTSPGLRPHWIANPEQNVCKPIIDHLYPDTTLSRIPTATVTGTVGKTTVCHMLSCLLQEAGLNVGLSSSNGLYMNSHRLITGDYAGAGGAYPILANPLNDCAVLEMARGSLIRSGLGIDGSDVGAVLNILDDHIGNDGIKSREDMATVKRLVADAARNFVVLNADDPLCVDIGNSITDKPICYVSMNPENPVLLAHLKDNGRAVYLGEQGSTIMFADGPEHEVILQTEQVPATLNNRVEQNIQNTLFASAIAWVMNIHKDIIASGLLKFQADFEFNPGRFNYFPGPPFEVILDFGHNPPGIKSVCDAALKLPCSGRRILVLTTPGNRRTEHFMEIAKACARSFDHYILHSWKDLRGRQPEFVPDQLRKGLIQYGTDEKRIEVITDESKALSHALESVKEGDQLVIMVQGIHQAKSRIETLRERAKNP